MATTSTRRKDPLPARFISPISTYNSWVHNRGVHGGGGQFYSALAGASLGKTITYTDFHHHHYNHRFRTSFYTCIIVQELDINAFFRRQFILPFTFSVRELTYGIVWRSKERHDVSGPSFFRLSGRCLFLRSSSVYSRHQTRRLTISSKKWTGLFVSSHMTLTIHERIQKKEKDRLTFQNPPVHFRQSRRGWLWW